MGVPAGSSVPFAVVLWFMRELPTPSTNNRQVQRRAIIFISHGPHGAGMDHPENWATATSSKNQVYESFDICCNMLSNYLSCVEFSRELKSL